MYLYTDTVYIYSFYIHPIVISTGGLFGESLTVLSTSGDLLHKQTVKSARRIDDFRRLIGTPNPILLLEKVGRANAAPSPPFLEYPARL